jgi:predicted nucleotidyltransferase
MFEPDILRTFPYSLDYRILGSLLDRMACSTLVSWQLRQHMAQYPASSSNETVCLFGSVARGEMDPTFSDIDLMFIGFDYRRRNEVLGALVQGQRSLDFHGAEELLARFEDPKAQAPMSLRFPVVTADDLLHKAEQSRRRMQFFIEATPISGDEAFARITERIMVYYGLLPFAKRRETPQAFLRDLNDFYKEMREEVSAETNNSRFFAKYLLVRELGQHFTRLGFLTAIFSKRRVLTSSRPGLEFARMLRQPPLGKLLFWISPFFLQGRTMSLLKHTHLRELKRRLKASSPDAMLVEIIFSIAKAYGDALDILHEPGMRHYLETAPANIVNWGTDTNLRLIFSQVHTIVSRLRKLADELESIFRLAQEKAVFNRPYSGSGLEAALRCFRQGLDDATIS